MASRFLFFLIINCLKFVCSYYLSLNSFQQPNAEQYCIEYCNSHLASIHNLSQHQELVQLINYTLNSISFIAWYSKPSVYIGYYHDNLLGWQYTDGTDDNIFNQWGWNGELSQFIANPNPAVGGCTILEKDAYFLQSIDCDWGKNDANGNYIFACNHCNGKLTKYQILDDDPQPINVQQERCSNIFHTALASIHTNNDMNETDLLIHIAQTQSNGWGNYEAYIGLNEQFKWDDGTTFDFGNDTSGGKYPWGVEQPDHLQQENCVLMDDGLWKDFSCNSVYAVCNAPSEICNATQWKTIIGNDNDWSIEPCQVDSNYGDSIAIIADKTWDNGDGPLIIEYMYRINEIGTNGGTAGIILHVNRSCNHYYYIGISLPVNQLFVTEIYNQQQIVLTTWDLNFVYLMDRYYLLRVELYNNKNIRIYINNEQYINSFINNWNKSSYIGIGTTNSRITAKSLFISGKIIFETNLYPQTWFNNCTMTMTVPNTTSNPITNVPTTTVPTMQPTAYDDCEYQNNGPIEITLDLILDTIVIRPITEISFDLQLNQPISCLGNMYCHLFGIGMYDYLPLIYTDPDHVLVAEYRDESQYKAPDAYPIITDGDWHSLYFKIAFTERIIIVDDIVYVNISNAPSTNTYTQYINTTKHITLVWGNPAGFQNIHDGTVTNLCVKSKYSTTKPTSSSSTPIPSMHPTNDPTSYPTNDPTSYSTNDPTTDPIIHLTINPSVNPTTVPTNNPSTATTSFLILSTTTSTTNNPTTDPITHPTINPSVNPTINPSVYPTTVPTNNPSAAPTSFLILSTTPSPTTYPTVITTNDPTTVPIIHPTINPTFDPSVTPTTSSILSTISSPTNYPTIITTKPSLDSREMDTTQSEFGSTHVFNKNKIETDHSGFWIVIGIFIAVICICCIFIIIMTKQKIQKNKQSEHTANIQFGIVHREHPGNTIKGNKAHLVENSDIPSKITKKLHLTSTPYILQKDVTDSITITNDMLSNIGGNTAGSGNVLNNDEFIINNDDDFVTPNGDTVGCGESDDTQNNRVELQNWLIRMKLPQYFDNFVSNGYKSLHIVQDIMNEKQLLEIDIVLKGHQTKLLAEIERSRNNKTLIDVQFEGVTNHDI